MLTRTRVAVAQSLGRWREWLWWQTAAGRLTRERLAALRGRYAGQRCFILGNGPSLRRTDVRLLRHEITIGSNGIFLLFPEVGFQTTFVTVEDPVVAEDRAGELNALHGTTKLFPHDLAHCLKADDDTVYLDFRRHYAGFPRFSEDLSERAFWGGTVTFLNLQLAWYLGCSPLYLIGFDHEYKMKVEAANGPIVSTAPDQNHFHPSYFGPGYRSHDPMFERMELSYCAAKEFLEQRGVAVYNATDGGKLEIYPRVSYSELVSHDVRRTAS